MRLRVTSEARRDVVNLLRRSALEFGAEARNRYDRLLTSAYNELLADPQRFGVQLRDDIDAGLRLYHLRHSRKTRARDREVSRPRHVIAFRIFGADLVILRVLHEAMDVAGQLGEPEGD